MKNGARLRTNKNTADFRTKKELCVVHELSGPEHRSSTVPTSFYDDLIVQIVFFQWAKLRKVSMFEKICHDTLYPFYEFKVDYYSDIVMT